MGEFDKSYSVVRNQIINPDKLELARDFRKNPTEEENMMNIALPCLNQEELEPID